LEQHGKDREASQISGEFFGMIYSTAGRSQPIHPMNETRNKLEYARLQDCTLRHSSRLGLAACVLCIGESFWLGVLGWLAWAVLFGDNEPGFASDALLIAVGAAPPAIAIALGILAIRSKSGSANRILGALGVCGGVGWLILLFSSRLFGL
jgi:hypothetical protein